MKKATRRHTKVITNMHICRQLGRCMQTDMYIHTKTYTNKNSLIGSHSKMNTEENSSDCFGKPTSHYCNHPYGVHCIINWNRQHCTYKYQTLNNSKQRDNRSQQPLTSDFSSFPQTPTAAAPTMTVAAATAAAAQLSDRMLTVKLSITDAAAEKQSLCWGHRSLLHHHPKLFLPFPPHPCFPRIHLLPNFEQTRVSFPQFGLARVVKRAGS